MDIVRVLRVLEYVGPREEIEEILSHRIANTVIFNRRAGKVTIRSSIIGDYPEILETTDIVVNGISENFAAGLAKLEKTIVDRKENPQ